MENPEYTMNFGGSMFSEAIAKLEPQVDWGPDGQEPNEPWTDNETLRDWMSSRGFNVQEQSTLFELLPRIDLALNHGPLFGVAGFINENTDDHAVLKAGYIVVATGCNGDFIVVRRSDDATGWLPMAMIWGMSVEEVNAHFVKTSDNLGEFILASDRHWEEVPKDWYEARDQKLT